jgi:hypothetical protein
MVGAYSHAACLSSAISQTGGERCPSRLTATERVTEPRRSVILRSCALEAPQADQVRPVGTAAAVLSAAGGKPIPWRWTSCPCPRGGQSPSQLTLEPGDALPLSTTFRGSRAREKRVASCGDRSTTFRGSRAREKRVASCGDRHRARLRLLPGAPSVRSRAAAGVRVRMWTRRRGGRGGR